MHANEQQHVAQSRQFHSKFFGNFDNSRIHTNNVWKTEIIKNKRIVMKRCHSNTHITPKKYKQRYCK